MRKASIPRSWNLSQPCVLADTDCGTEHWRLAFPGRRRRGVASCMLPPLSACQCTAKELLIMEALMGPSRPREPWIYPSDRGRGHRRAHGGAPGRSPCSVQEFEGQSCAPKRSQRQHVNERVWLAALVTGHWGLPRAGDGGWMAESLDGHLQMRCLFSLLLGDGNVNTNSLSHQRPSPGHRGERSPRRNLFFAGPLSCFHLPSPSRPKALQHPSPSPSPIDRRGTPPSGGRSSCTSHNCHPCSRIPPTPSVPPFYRSTRRL